MRLQLGWFDDKLAGRITAIGDGTLTPAAPRDAATVMVIRPAGGGRGVEVLMLKRPASMKFAAGAYVFPGGSVDPADAGADVAWAGPPPEQLAARLGTTPQLARALACAAVRETFEEVGILLASGPDGTLAVPQGPGWAADRAAVNRGELSMAGLLARRDLVLRPDLLTPWARWITPLAEPRRFDTWFFAAALPAGQEFAGNAAEADRVAWLAPDAALAAFRRGELSFLPPTAATLAEFAAASCVADILGQRRSVTAVEPVLSTRDGQAWLEVPDDAGYPG